MRRFITSVILLLLSLTSVHAQKSREQLEKEKAENQARIERAQRVLNQTSRKKQASLSQVKALNTQISNQTRQIELINEDLGLIQSEISQLEAAKKEQEDKLEKLKKEYAEMLYIASKSSGKINQLSFLFSARSFNDLVMRYKYLQQYTDDRKSQVNKIQEVQEGIVKRQEELQSKKSTQQLVINDKQKEAQKLARLKDQQTQTVKSLVGEEKKLRAEIAASKKAVKRLDNLISSLISKSTAAASVSAGSNEAVVNTALSTSFQNNKNKLPWPVRNGFISDRFGVKDHPVLKNIKIDNNGVDIQTSPNARVSSVFNGKVLDISQIPGLGNVVAIQHGEYFTVYANLSSVNVKIGDEVITGQLIGIAGQKDGDYAINFQVWHQFTKMNPEGWLARK